MTTVQLCEENGFLWAVALPDGVDDCEVGPIIGPPEGLKKHVHNRLAEAGIYTAFDLMGNRNVLVKILEDLGEPKEYAREVLSIYQSVYFAEKDE